MPKRKTTKPPKFTLSRVGSALDDAKQIPVVLRAKLTAVLEQLAREGCRAADYALSGPPPWPHLGAVHFDGWRVVVAFPTDDEVAILKIAPHDAASDPYREIAEDLGIPVSTGPRTKPPCCEPDGTPPAACTFSTSSGSTDAQTTRNFRICGEYRKIVGRLPVSRRKDLNACLVQAGLNGIH